MKSRLFQETPPLIEPPGCGPCRQERFITIRHKGRLIRIVVRDKIVVEDSFLVMVKAAAFSIQTGALYNASPVKRNYKDFLIKSSLTI